MPAFEIMEADGNRYHEIVVSMDTETAQRMQPATPLQLPDPKELETDDDDVVAIPALEPPIENEGFDWFLVSIPETSKETASDLESALDAEGSTSLPSPKGVPVILGPGPETSKETASDLESALDAEGSTSLPSSQGVPVRKRPAAALSFLQCPSANLAFAGLGKRGRRAPQAENRALSAPVEQPEVRRAPLAGNPGSSAPVAPPKFQRPAKKLASSAMKTSRSKKPMRLEDTITRGCFVLLHIPHGKYKTKTFSYKKYGGRE